MKSLSVTGKKWVLNNFDEEEVKIFKDNFFLDEITARLLSIKKINKENVKNFLNPIIKNNLPNPDELKDMNKATNRFVAAICNEEKIGFFGDYDVDGATATALLGRYLDDIKKKYEFYIPDRKTEGYGPNIKSFDKLICKGASLICTLDCGTLSFEPIEYLYKKNIDVIILDHHQSEINLPKAHSIINPNRFDDKSDLKYLCAAGVCFMFLISLNRALRRKNWFKENKVQEPDLITYLDLVSLGTVCDVVPLIGLNRAIVKQGLKILALKKNLGIKTLMELCRIECKPTPYHLGYVLGPRINAGGRVGKCAHGANLLLNKNPKDSFYIASELDSFNKERQLIEKDLLKKIESNIIDINDPVIIIAGEDWHEGVIGIIASRIKEKFNKPSIVISLNNNLGKGSARSVFGYDIGSMIISAVQKGIIFKGGGHKMAGGFTLDIKKIEDFKEHAIKMFKKSSSSNSEVKKIFFDSEIAPSALNIEFYEKINMLSPFGSGNVEPKFKINNVRPMNSKIIGEKHIKSVMLGEDGSSIKTISFNATQSDIGAYLLTKNSKTFNIVGKLSLNEWRGQKNVEFIIDDISVNKNIKNTVPSSIG